MSEFTVETDAVHLPAGAYAKTRRRNVRWRGADVVAFTQGPFRPYLYPVYTPAGFAVTTESPPDHPHHNSVWVGADHVHCRVPVAGGRTQEYTYNFYVGEVFQGRAPGRIQEVGWDAVERGPGLLRVSQRNEWRGPGEWGAPEGRVVAVETRVVELRPGAAYHLIDIRSRLEPNEWDIALGPTRHAYFNVRVAESMRATHGGTVSDSEGRTGGDKITGTGARWVDFSGPVGGGRVAGVAMLPGAETDQWSWHVFDWGTVTLDPLFPEGRLIRCGEAITLGCRFVVYDGDARSIDLEALYRTFREATAAGS